MKSAFRASMAWLHRWAGIILSALMYFIFVTGTTGFFHFEMDRWMEPERPLAMHWTDDGFPSADTHHYTAYTNQGELTLSTRTLIELGTERLQQQAHPESVWWGIILPTARNGNFWVEWQPPRGPNGERTEREAEYLDFHNGEPLWIQPRDTGGGMALYRLHWRLHYLPDTAAYWIVGLCTLLMLVGLVSGVIIHRRIFREFFTLRLFRRARSWLDLHNLSSVLALPFQIMIVYSGLVFFAVTFMEPIVTARYGDEGTRTFYKEAYPEAEAEAKTGERADSVAIVPLLEEAQAETGQRIEQMYLLHPGDQNAQLSFYLPEPSPGHYEGKPHKLLYRASTGERLDGGEQQYGGAASVEKTLIALHEGLFADWPLRWLYILCSLLGIIMIATGALYFVKKRTASRPDEYAKVERFYAAVILGLPLAIAVYFFSNRLIPVDLAGRADWEMHSLFLAWLVSGVFAWLRPRTAIWRELLVLNALGWGLLPVVNALTTDRHLGISLAVGDWVLAGFDLTALALAASFALMAGCGYRQISASIRVGHATAIREA
ncbi:PepSY domain-containing protein [Marinimicrobium sp. LS-A18]|uniref:PepSY-associated TM helix domain-containing protein n=1 Tax=Marinimicrobium sp. LS-A18 TaxID=1381596 RepID=UPI0004631680|nr:PepSY-associated TM helix domain-containing protein [Marinimicrobium sp. LS-A18]